MLTCFFSILSSRKQYFQENDGQAHSNMSQINCELKSKLHYSIGNYALVGKITFGSMKGIDASINGWADCRNPVCDEGREQSGELREESAQCRASLSGMGLQRCKVWLVLGFGGQPELEGEPRVQKWPLGSSPTQRGLSLVYRSTAAQDVTQTQWAHTYLETHKDTATHCCYVLKRIESLFHVCSLLTTCIYISLFLLIDI